MPYSKIIFHGQSVSVENSPSGPVATGWQQGLPVARRPISMKELERMLAKFPDHTMV